MDLLNLIKDKVPWKKQERDDIDNPEYDTISLPQQPHLELFSDIRNERRSAHHYCSIAKLWRVDEKGREALFSCYLGNANCLVVITQDVMDKMALSYQYQHKQASIPYELYYFSGKSFLDWHLEQFHRPEPFRLHSSHIVHVTAIQKHSVVVVFGFNSTGQLTLYCYSVQYETPFSFQSFSEPTDRSEKPLIRNNVEPGELSISVHCAKPYVIKENQFSKLTTRVVGETQEDGTLAVIFSDCSNRPRPNLLFVWQLVPKVILLRYIDLKTVYQSIRGIVTGLSFWNDQRDMIMATNASQLFHLSLENDDFSKNYINLKKKHIFLENEEELINIIKVRPKYQRDMKVGLYGIGECGNLYMIPHLEDWRSQPVKMIKLTDKLPIADCKMYSHQVSSYSKQLFLLGQNKYLYVYDLARQTFINAVHLPDDKHDIDENWTMNMSVNWYGTEVYFTCWDHLYCVECPVVDTSLKEMARKAVLKNYSEEFLINLNLSKSILGFLFNKNAY